MLGFHELFPETLKYLGFKPMHNIIAGFLMLLVGFPTILYCALNFRDRKRSFSFPKNLPTSDRIQIELFHLINEEKSKAKKSIYTALLLFIIPPFVSFGATSTFKGDFLVFLATLAFISLSYIITLKQIRKRTAEDLEIIKEGQTLIIDKKGVTLPFLIITDSTRRQMRKNQKSHLMVPWEHILKVVFITMSTEGGGGTPFIQFHVQGESVIWAGLFEGNRMIIIERSKISLQANMIINALVKYLNQEQVEIRDDMID